MLLRLSTLLNSALIIASATAASSAFAFIDGEVLVGKRWYQYEGPNNVKAGIASQEVDVAAHIDPIPLVPVSFGAKVQLGTLDENDIKSSGGFTSVDTAAVFAAGLDIMAWIPFVPVITPYVRLDVPVTGTMTIKGKQPYSAGGVSQSADYADVENISGADLNIGAKWSPVPLVKILAEYGRGMESHKMDSLKSNGLSQPTDSKTYSLASNSFQLGVEIGF